tara:strand:- start:1773 stop:2162 length:390 start_codon:yes stop_codon:yes gene_type:complete
MTEYDNTNSGAVFKPRDDMKMILQGPVNLEGNDRDFIIVTDKTQAGQNIMKLYQKVGAMFNNDKGDNENKPDYSGNIDDYATNKDMRVSGWKKNKDGKKYITLSIQEKNTNLSSQKLNTPQELDEDIPF